MLIELLAGQLFLSIFNVANVNIDAYLIFNNKRVGHLVNFCAYAILTTLLCILFPFSTFAVVLFCISAFLNRQFTFDIPLNLRRGLEWDYQTLDASSNASLLDRLERSVFGNSPNVGKKIFKAYLACYAVTIILWLWIV